MDERVEEYGETLSDLKEKVTIILTKIEEVESGDEVSELKEEMQTALTQVVNDLSAKLEEFQERRKEDKQRMAEMEAQMDARFADLTAEIKVCMTAVADGGTTGVVQRSQSNAPN